MIARLILAALLLFLSLSAPSAQLSMMGIGPAGSGPAGAGCTGTSLSFTTACNSMYIPIIH